MRRKEKMVFHRELKPRGGALTAVKAEEAVERVMAWLDAEGARFNP